MVIVLGIDPGTAHTGYGVVISRGRRLAALDGGVIGTGADEPLERRLARIHARVCDLIAEHRPAAVAVEDLFFGQNARTAFAVGQARGVVLLGRDGRRALLLVHAPGGQAGGLRLGHGRQGAGPAHGRRPARARRAAPARSRGRRARRGDLPRQRRAHARGAAIVIASVRGTVLSPCGRPRGDRGGRGGLPPRRIGAHPARDSARGARGRPVTHLVVRDDAMHLFGFASEEERGLFLMLVGVQGVGPKVALAVLSGGAPRELLNAIAAGDAARFQAVPGIGKRTAERIVVELREKVAGEAPESSSGAVATTRACAREGLVGLGFTPQEADALLDRRRGRDRPRS